MQNNKEHGFSLVLVLFTIVLFSVIGLSLFTLTNSSAKQVNKTQTQLEITDVAEMGITYFETIFTEHFYKVLAEEVNKIELAYYSSIDQNTVFVPISDEYIISQLSQRTIPALDLSNIDLSKVLDPDIKFIIKNIEYHNFGDNPVAKFNSTGYVGSTEQATLGAEIKVNLEKYFSEFVENVPQTNPFEPSKSYLTPETPKVILDILKDCPNGNCSNKICKVNSGNYQDFQNCEKTDIYVNSTLTTPNNGKFSVDNTNAYISDVSEISNFGAQNSHVFINGSLNIKNNFVGKIENSWLRVNGDLKPKNNITKDIKNSTILVFGTFGIKNMNGSIENSLVCAKDFDGNWKGQTDNIVHMTIDSINLKCIDNRTELPTENVYPTPTPSILDREIDVSY